MFFTIFSSCNTEQNIEDVNSQILEEEKIYFVLKDSERKVVTELPNDLISIVANEIQKQKGEDALEAFLNTYDLNTGLLKVSSEIALKNLYKSPFKSRTEMTRVPFTLNLAWGFQRSKNARNGFFSTDYKSQSFNPNVASTTSVGHRKTKFRSAKQAMWGFSFGITDNSNPSARIMETYYPVRIRAFSDANSTWSNWVTLDSNRSTGFRAWRQGKHAEALQIEMLPNPDNNEKLFDLLMYQVYHSGRWQPWVTSPRTAGRTGGEKLQGVHIRGFYFN